MRYLFFLFFFFSGSLVAFDYCDLTRVLYSHNPPFCYPLEIKINPAPCRNAPVLVAFHGMGSNNKIADILSSYPVIQDHIVSFNLPDHDIDLNRDPYCCTSYGTIHELLPAIYVLKRIVVDGGADAVNLYGFSSGGAVLINVIRVLNCSDYDSHLENIGIRQTHKKHILNALQNGYLILDCPMKSIEEIINLYGQSHTLCVLEQQYKLANLRPINSIERFENLHLNILLYFEDSDECVGSRDNDLFIQRLRCNNPLGNTVVVIGSSGGHLRYHTPLWEAYPSFIRGMLKNTLIKGL